MPSIEHFFGALLFTQRIVFILIKQTREEKNMLHTYELWWWSKNGQSNVDTAHIPNHMLVLYEYVCTKTQVDKIIIVHVPCTMACYRIPIGIHRSLIWLKQRHIHIIQPLFNIIYYNSIVNAAAGWRSKRITKKNVFFFNVYFSAIQLLVSVAGLAVFKGSKVYNLL